jgi:glycosyltransferase involved in cell wall biosynthesis
MRIAIIASPFIAVPPKKYGGTERVIHYLIKGLMNQGHEVILFAPGDSEVDCKLVPICDKAIPFAKNKEEDLALQPLRLEAEKKAKDELRKYLNQIDIIHSHGVDLSDFQDFPCVTTLHGPINLETMDYYEKRRNQCFISISNNQQETFPTLKYIGTVYNGLDPDEFDLKTEAEDYLCFLGRFDREKNPHLAIQLALKLNMKLKMAGKIDLAGNDYFEEMVRPYLENPLIEYAGEIGMPEKMHLLGGAKCNLHPTGFREPFGLSILEAAYCGTPTMAIARGSMPELIEENRTGILVEDFDEAYHLIEKCYEMDRNYISQRARLLFNYNTMAKQYVSAYEKVIQLFKQEHGTEFNLGGFLQDANSLISQIWRGSTNQEKPETV